MKALRKRIAIIFISVAAIVMSLNLSAFKNKVLAATENGFNYEIDEGTGTVVITKYTEGGTNVNIPKELGGKMVTGIGNYAFSECSSLTSITIPDSVTSIGVGAFSECSSLASISVDEANTKYDSRNNCKAIIDSTTNELIAGCKNTVIPAGVKSIGNNAFWGCINLTNIIIPEGVTSIGENAFRECISLENVTIPKGVESIGNMAFYNCDKFTAVELPASVVMIGNMAFAGCDEILTVMIDKNNKKYTSGDNCNAIIDINEKRLEEGFNTTVIPDWVTSIGSFAFDECSKIETIKIPDNVVKIGDSCFFACSGLKSVEISSGVTELDSWTFVACKNLTSIKIPYSVSRISNSAFDKSDDLTIYVDMESRVNEVKNLSGLEKVVYDQAVYHKHNYSNAWTTDGTSHWHKCTMCDAKKDVTAHSGGTATCTNKAKCAVCGKEYGEVKHIYSNEWKTDGTNHWHACTACGIKKDVTAHSGGTATCTAKAKCAVCGKEYGKAKGHSYSTEWKTDGTNHWHVCTVCGVKKDIAAHKGGTATCTNKAKCAVCGKEYGNAKGHTYTYVYTKSTTKADGKIVKKCTVCGKVAATSVIKKPATLTTANTSYAYTGSQIKPSVTVRDSAGKTIPATEYTVTYGTNKAVGKGTVKITFKGKKYSGTMTKTFNIIPKATAVTSIANGAAGITIKWSKNTTGTGYMIYRCETGAKYQRIKTIADNTVLSFTDKNVENGKAYKYKVLPYKIIDEVNYYNNTGAGKATYRLTTPTVKAANTASGSITVKWSRNAAVTGYQVVYKVGTASKTLTFTDKMIGSTVIKSLKKGSTCKIYVRSFTKNGTSTFYSGWSAVNTVKIVK